jgi:hypothetical protein
MLSLVRRLLMIVVLLASLLALGVAPASAHCVETSQGIVHLFAGHLAAAHGHETAIASSGTLLQLEACLVDEHVNDRAPAGSTTDPRTR